MASPRCEMGGSSPRRHSLFDAASDLIASLRENRSSITLPVNAGHERWNLYQEAAVKQQDADESDQSGDRGDASVGELEFDDNESDGSVGQRTLQERSSQLNAYEGNRKFIRASDTETHVDHDTNSNTNPVIEESSQESNPLHAFASNTFVLSNNGDLMQQTNPHSQDLCSIEYNDENGIEFRSCAYAEERMSDPQDDSKVHDHESERKLIKAEAVPKVYHMKVFIL
ncbi:unnamed protein product [Phytophthora lilii]|uniref:Unnamed protein product n=1 Tax=Phytophthora lilii TaxID=2077276 RepID=A0A9W7CM53_9STRA|nr:unnamed protein product [Phytophthora lilii]